MEKSWWTFRILMITVLSVGVFYLGRRLTSEVQTVWGRRMIWAGMVGMMVLQAIAPSFYRAPGTGSLGFFPRLLVWASFTSLGFIATLAFFVVTKDLLLLGKWGVAQAAPKSLEWGAWSASFVSPSRRQFFFGLLGPLGLGSLAAASSAAGFFQARCGARLKEIEVPVPNLDPRLEGFRIAQVTDLHVGMTIRRDYVDAVVATIHEAKPDLVAFTGDFIDGFVPDLEAELAPLGSVRSTHGTFYVPGNHEYYWGIDDWLAHFGGKLGFKILTNAHQVVTHQGAKILVAGVEDHSVHRMGIPRKPDIEAALKGAPPASEIAFRVLLSHQPKGLKEAEQMDAQLQLSGHTHAGQFFPVSLLNRFFHPYWRGLNRHSERLWVYVSAGTGYWGPPNRFAVPAEVTLLTLKRAVTHSSGSSSA